MKKLFSFAILALTLATSLVSCSNEDLDLPVQTATTEQLYRYDSQDNIHTEIANQDYATPTNWVTTWDFDSYTKMDSNEIGFRLDSDLIIETNAIVTNVKVLNRTHWNVDTNSYEAPILIPAYSVTYEGHRTLVHFKDLQSYIDQTDTFDVVVTTLN